MSRILKSLKDWLGLKLDKNQNATVKTATKTRRLVFVLVSSFIVMSLAVVFFFVTKTGKKNFYYVSKKLELHNFPRLQTELSACKYPFTPGCSGLAVDTGQLSEKRIAVLICKIHIFF